MINFKNIPESDKPRERLYQYGSENLSDEELISIILKTGTKGISVKEVSLKLLENVGDIKRLKDIGINTLIGINGIGRVKAIEIKAAIELGRRIYIENNKLSGVILNNSLKIYEILLVIRNKNIFIQCMLIRKEDILIKNVYLLVLLIIL